MADALLHIRPGREDEDRGPLGVEHLLSALHPLLKDGLTLTIASVEGSIRFYLRVPKEHVGFVQSLVYGQYPAAHCMIVTDDPIGMDPATTTSLYLRLRRPGVFPIKRHPQLVDPATRAVADPLAMLLTALAHPPEPRMRLVFSIELTPRDDQYRTRGTAAMLDLATRAFAREESATDRYVQLRTLGGVRGLIARPLAAIYFRRISPSDETTHRAAVTESTRTHDRESDLQACLAKLRRHLFQARIQLAVSGPGDMLARQAALRSLAASFGQFDLPGLNGFTVSRGSHPAMLSTEEIATLWRLPGSAVQSPHIEAPYSRVLPPPHGMRPDGATDTRAPRRAEANIGVTLYRAERRPVVLATDTRRRHVWALGKSGTGKTTLLENLLLADIERGEGVALIDPHGDLADSVLQKIPSRRTNDVILIDLARDPSHPIAFNPLDVPMDKAPFAVDGLVATFFKIFGAGEFGSWGPRLEDILRASLLALAEAGGMTLLDLLRLFADDEPFRQRVLRRVRNPVVSHWFAVEFPRLRANHREDPFAAVTNKLRQLLASPSIRDMLAQPRNRLDLRAAMDEGRIVLCNLAKGRLGERTSMFLGSLLITRFQLDAMSRADRPEPTRRDFFLTIDEFQNFATQSFADILSEARKYRLNLTLANQYSAQMPESLAQAIWGNVGTIVSFAVGQEDAALLAQQMGPPLTPDDLVALPRHTAYVRTEFGGTLVPPFSLATLPPRQRTIDQRRAAAIRRASRARYASPRAAVVARVHRTLQPLAKEGRLTAWVERPRATAMSAGVVRSSYPPRCLRRTPEPG